MNTSLHKRFKNYDFAGAKPVKEIPALRKLQAQETRHDPARVARRAVTCAGGRMNKTIVGSVSHHACEVEELRADRELSIEYVKVAMESLNDPADHAVGLLMLRTVAEAYGGLGAVAKEAGVSRETLYRALSPKGNPTLKILLAVVKAVGLKLSIESAPCVAA